MAPGLCRSRSAGHQTSTPWRDGTLRISTAIGLGARVLHGDVLALDARTVAQGQHDGADHRDEQDQAGELEEVDVVRVEHPAEGLGVGDGLGAGDGTERAPARGPDRSSRSRRRAAARSGRPRRSARRSGRYCWKPWRSCGEIHVEHHHDEQEQHRHRADVDDDQDHRQELGAHHHEQPGGVHEGQDQEEHRGHGIARGDHHEARGDGHTCEQVEEGSGCAHAILEISRPEDGPFCRNCATAHRPPVYRTRPCGAQPPRRVPVDSVGTECPLSHPRRAGRVALGRASAMRTRVRCQCSAVGRVHREVARDLALPAVAVQEQLLLVVEQLLAGLDRELEVRPLDDGVHRAGLLAHAAIDALHHVEVVAGRAAGAVVAARARLDGDGLGGADRLAQLAGDAALLAVGVAAQGVLAPEARAAMAHLEGVVDRGLRLEEVLHRQDEPGRELLQQQTLGDLIELHGSDLREGLSGARREAGELEDEGDDDDRDERERQEHLPAEAHELVVAVARHHGLHHGDHEEQEARLEDEPDQARHPGEGRERDRREPAAEEQDGPERAHGHDRHVLAEHEQQVRRRGILDHVAGHELGFGLRQVEGRAVRLGHRRDEEHHEHREQPEPVPAEDAERGVLRHDDPRQVQGAGAQQHADDDEADGDLVGDHLRRRAQRAEERVFRVRGPAAHDDAVDAERRDREDVE